MKFFIPLIALLTTSQLWAEDPVPTKDLYVGVYQSDGYIGTPEIKRWAESFRLLGLIRYGETLMDVEFDLIQPDATKINYFSGKGKIIQHWSTGHTCYYPVKIELYNYLLGKKHLLYSRFEAPSSIYSKWDIVNKGCPPPGGEYAWTTEENPYLLEETD